MSQPMHNQPFNPNTPPQQAPAPNPNLPPAGHARDEVLKERTDNLQQQAEMRSNEEERFAMDPNKMAPIREIRHNMSALNVTNKQKGYKYCWVNFKSPVDTPGLAIQQKQAIQVQVNGAWEAVWEVVYGDMPECANRKGIGADTTRRLGDVLLMRAKESNYNSLMKYNADQSDRRILADEAALMDAGERVNSQTRGGITIHPHGDPRFMNAAGRGKTQGIIQNTPSQEELNFQLKTGRLPGANMENFAGKG